MKKRVLDVGNCVPDHAAIRRMITMNFSAEVLQTQHLEDTLATLRQQKVDLVLVNRKLDADYSDGLAVIEQIKSTPELRDVPIMMVTNYADHQQQAMAAGAELGFGKLSLSEPETLERLKKFLG
jgi:CheY-like chemotaxis protein